MDFLANSEGQPEHPPIIIIISDDEEDVEEEVEEEWEGFLLLKAQIFDGKNKEFKTVANGMIYVKERICVPNFEFLKK